MSAPRYGIFSCIITGFLMVFCLSGCGLFNALEDDLEALEQERFQAIGNVQDKTASGDPLLVVYLGSSDGEVILNFKPLNSPGEFETWLTVGDGWFFGFADANRDSMYQTGESYGWSHLGGPVNPGILHKEPLQISIEAAGSGQPAAPPKLVGRLIPESAILTDATAGEIASTSEQRFSEEAASDGLWKPYTSHKGGTTGVFFLEPYDPDRIPVLFVHGIGGYPAQFDQLIDSLDQERYQAWFLNYPSGFRLKTLGNGVYYLLEGLHRKLGFRKMHLVAHSMGGLVSRWALGVCSEQNSCAYLKTFTSIASPFGGVKSSAYGVEYAPEVVPAWRDLEPGSEFLVELFEQPLPGSVEHYLIFGFRMDLKVKDLIAGESSDGVIPLSSQLRKEAQQQSVQLTGFDQTHVGVLSDPAAIEVIKQSFMSSEIDH